MKRATAYRAGRACLLAGALGAGAGCASVPQGERAVDSVRIVPARALSSSGVVENLATTASPKLLGLFPGIAYDYSILDPVALQRDLARVERYYQSHGFLEAHVRAARVVSSGTDHVRVTIVVDEGPPTVNRTVRLDGLDEVPAPVADAARSAARVALPQGARFDEETYKSVRGVLSRTLQDEGYAYATVKADAVADPATHAVDYTFAFRPGPATVFGAVTFEWSKAAAGGPAPRTVDEGPLRRAMHLLPGTPYSVSSIERATQALLDLNVLSTVEVVPQLAEPPAAVVPLTVNVQAAQLHQVRLGGGAEFDQMKAELHGLAGWEHHDFLGGLRTLNVELKPGVVLYPTRVNNLVAPTSLLPEALLQAQLRSPGVFESRMTLFVLTGFSVYPMLVETNPDPAQPVIGYMEPKGTLGLERRFGRHVFASLGHTVQYEVPFAYLGSSDPNLPPVFVSFPQLVTRLDLRDDPIHPHSGFYAANDLQVAAKVFGSEAQDLRLQPEVRGYVPLASGVTLAARGGIGLLFASNYGDYVQHHLGGPTPNNETSNRDIELVYFRGFFAGGPNSNRGYPIRGIAPHGTVPFLLPGSQYSRQCPPGMTTSDPSACSSAIGGFTRWELSAEVRFDIKGPLGAAVFCDSADVSAQPLTFRLDHPHLSCGAGARYDTPVGPIRLDVGYRIQPLQVLGAPDETAAFEQDPTEGLPPTLFGLPMALVLGIGDPF